MSPTDITEAAAILRGLSTAIAARLIELRDLADRCPDPAHAASIRASMERITAAGRDVSRALVEIHKG
jgi:hypothetical protein